MERLRNLAPWQIIGISVAVLLVFMVVAYLVVTRLTTSNTAVEVKPTVPGDLENKSKDLSGKLDKFEAPRGTVQPFQLRTPDPFNPSTVNPFSG